MKYEPLESHRRRGSTDLGPILGLATIVVLAIVALMFIVPKYNVWRQAKAGEALLRHAEFSRKVTIQEANAKMESASMLARAEVERAKGVAEANKIIGESLKGNDAYLRYLWISELQQGDNRETIYVPTEAGLPILEAGRFGKSPPR